MHATARALSAKIRPSTFPPEVSSFTVVKSLVEHLRVAAAQRIRDDVGDRADWEEVKARERFIIHRGAGFP